MTSILDHQCSRTSVTAVLLAAALAMPAVAQSAASLTGSVEFPAETAAIVAATTALFDAVEGDPAPRTGRPVIVAPMDATPVNFDLPDEKAGILTARGDVRHLTGFRITWYPVERFLGSVDFMGTWEGNKNLVCGSITWDLSDPHLPVLDDISATFVDIGELSRNTDEDIHAALLEANCAYGAIEANYTIFE